MGEYIGRDAEEESTGPYVSRGSETDFHEVERGIRVRDGVSKDEEKNIANLVRVFDD